MEASLARDVFFLKQPAHLLDPLLEARHALVHRHAKVPELIGQEGSRKSDIESPAADPIKPVSHTDKPVNHTMVKSFDEKIEVRWHSGLHSNPQRFMTSGSLLSAMQR